MKKQESVTGKGKGRGETEAKGTDKGGKKKIGREQGNGRGQMAKVESQS